jgi:hypothetical protein
MSSHYIRYHKSVPGNPLNSRPGAFEAWAEIRPKQPGWEPPVGTGDIVWLLSGKDGGGPRMSYRLEYFFLAAGKPMQEGGRFVIRGSEGVLFDSCPGIANEPWFDKFHMSIGRGGTSFQKIQDAYLPYFLDLIDASRPETDSIDAAIAEAEASDSPEDAKQLRAIMSRRGQPEFRTKLLSAYEGQCCFSGCEVEGVLEAAHIKAHTEEPNYSLTNGLLLRADLHTLFDLHLIGIDQFDRIRVSKSIKQSEYGKFDGQRIRLPRSLADRPNQRELGRRLEKLT